MSAQHSPKPRLLGKYRVGIRWTDNLKRKLEIFDQIPSEVVHFYDHDTGNMISSRANKFDILIDNKTHKLALPLHALKKPFTLTRLGRRLSRVDKSSAVFNLERDGVVLLYDGLVFFYDLQSRMLSRRLELRNCRNVLHGGIAVTPHGIYFGEYGSNPDRSEVPIWRSVDGGRNWYIVFNFAAGKIKHVHGVYFDSFSDRLWVTSGDADGECVLVSADHDFKDLQFYGDGTQAWRPVSLLFSKSNVIWAMDSPLKPSHLQVMDRKTGALQTAQRFDGPVWYTKVLVDGTALLQSSVEPGPSVRTKHAQLFSSKDLIHWNPVAKFRKDIWPMPWFKYGVIGFADGPQTTEDFIIFGEALNGLDGASYHARLV